MKKYILFTVMIGLFTVSAMADVPLVVGHRGNSSVAPENTMSSFRACIESGAQGAECDVYRTTDGKLVLHHDGKLNRTVRDAQGNPAEGRITDYTLAKLQTMDFGIWKDAKFKGEKVATLDEYLDALKGTNCAPVIELKQSGLEADVIEAVRKRGMEKQTTIIAFNDKVIKTCRELAPEIRAAWLCGKGKKESDDQYVNRVLEVLKSCNTTYVDMEHSALTPEMLKLFQDNGITVMVWTVDKPERIKALFDMGVTSVTTNVPATALEVHAKIGK